MRFYRTLFSLAALYNLAFGLWAGFFPQHFFQLFSLPPPLYPSLWACLGMVVGIYAFAYAHVAWKPHAGDFLVALGLLGKLLGPIGWLVTVKGGELPSRTFFLILCNDLVWWFPFLFYLLRNVAWRGRIFTFILVAVHAAGCFGLWMGRAVPLHLLVHTFFWILLWFFWVLSSLSLPAFLACWILKLRREFQAKPWVWLGLAVCLLGVAFDLAGELIFITWLPASREIDKGLRLYNYLSAGTANGLYCAGGLFLSAVAWRLGMVRGAQGMLGFLMWTVGFSLTLMAALNHQAGIELTGAATMALFIPWAAWVGWKL